MNIVHAALLYLFAKPHLDKAAARGHHPKWPGTHHPPPRRAPKHRRAPVHHAPAHHAPAHHARHAPAHHVPDDASPPHLPAEHADSAPLPHVTHHHKRHHVHHAQPVITHADAAPPDTHAEPIEAVHAAPPEPPAASESVEQHAQPAGEYDIAQLQAIERNLGWRGAGTTKGPLDPRLTDGLYGPVTHGNWQASARKRGLPETFERTGPNTAVVDVSTFNQLLTVARQLRLDPQGAVVGRAGRGLYIP